MNELVDGAEQRAPSKSADDPKLGAAADTPGSCAAIHGHVNKLGRWDDSNHMKLNKWKCPVVPLGNTLRHQGRLRVIKWKTTWQGRPGGHQVDPEPVMSPHGKSSQWPPGLC